MDSIYAETTVNDDPVSKRTFPFSSKELATKFFPILIELGFFSL